MQYIVSIQPRFQKNLLRILLITIPVINLFTCWMFQTGFISQSAVAPASLLEKTE